MISGVEVSSLVSFKLKVYKAENCPLCKRKVPIDKILGHGKQKNPNDFFVA